MVRDRQATDDNIIQRMRIVRSITKATDTHSEYVILIVFAWKQWLRERASLLRVVPVFLFHFSSTAISLSPKGRRNCDTLLARMWCVQGELKQATVPLKRLGFCTRLRKLFLTIPPVYLFLCVCVCVELRRDSVSRPPLRAHHTRQESSGRVIGPSQGTLPT